MNPDRNLSKSGAQTPKKGAGAPVHGWKVLRGFLASLARQVMRGFIWVFQVNLLGFVFAQYSDARRLRFGSRFARFMGNLVLGRPENRGLDVLKSGQCEQYYLLTPDRVPPTSKSGLDEWRREGIFTAQFRYFDAAESSKRLWVIGTLLCFVMVGSVGLAVHGIGAFTGLSGKFSAMVDADDGTGTVEARATKTSAMTRQDCEALRMAVQLGQVSEVSEEVFVHCNQLLK